MSQHGDAVAVADGIDARHVGLVVVIHDHLAAFQLYARRFQTCPVRIRSAAYCDQYDFSGNFPGLAAQHNFGRQCPVGLTDRFQFGAVQKCYPCFGQALLQVCRQLGVDARQDLRQQFNNGHFRPDRRVQGSKFDADHAAADDCN